MVKLACIKKDNKQVAPTELYFKITFFLLQTLSSYGALTP
jgi:hypothetical protein